MADPTIIKVDLNVPILPISAAPGTKIIIRGSFISRHDGSIIDAVTTSWPKDAPGGESVDPIGLMDLDAGGLHMMSRDIPKHEVHAVVTDAPGQACSAAGVSSPCLVLNNQLALKRLLTTREMWSTMNGSMTVEVPPPLAPPIVPATAVPVLQIFAAFFLLILVAIAGWRWKRTKENSAEGQLLALSRKVMAQLQKADQVIAAPLKPTVDAAVKAIVEKRVDAASKEGQRVADALRRVNERLESTAREERAAKEQEAADELLREMESALEAAEEMKRSHP
jgi:hypothetical protein